MSRDHGAETCPFCHLPGERIIAENEKAIAIRDRFPVAPLHTLIIPRRHIGSYFALTEQEVMACHRLLTHVREQILSQDVSVGGFNVGINGGAVAGQTIWHCHIHLIPRRRGDVTNARGGVRHVIPGKGCYPTDPPSDDEEPSQGECHGEDP
jgi:ATP adenylyltransferase